MRGAFQIAKFFGIPVRIHWSFGLIFLWAFYLGFRENWAWTSIGWFLLFIGALFVCVVLHEFGHALTARRYGVSTRDIILSPIGGVARLDKLPEQPMQEFYVAVAGPLVNVGIMAILSPYLLFISSKTEESVPNIIRSFFNLSDNIFLHNLTQLDYFFFGLIALNGTLAVFNMLPAFPMDGGRVLRALLSIPLGRMQATRIATYIGQFLAVLLFAYGIWQGSPITALIGVFIFFMAAGEYRMVRMDKTLSQHTVAEVVRPHFTKFYLNDTMEKVAEAVTHGWEKNFLIFDEWQNLRGVLTEEGIMRAVKQQAFNRPVTDFMLPGYEALLPTDSLRDALAQIQNSNRAMCPVYHPDGRLMGVVEAGMLQNFIRMQQRMQ